MSKEQAPQPDNPFGLTDNERLFDRIHHRRLIALVADELTAIHRIELSSNIYGEFLFVTTSRTGEQKAVYLTFYGLGYHDHRERWIVDEWFWYESHTAPKAAEPQPSREETLALIHDRYTEVAGYSAGEVQSQRGKLFELLADLTDEDGALTELEDLENWFDFDDE